MRVLCDKKHEDADNNGSKGSGDLLQANESDHDSDYEGSKNEDKSPRTEMAEKLKQVELFQEDYTAKFNELKQAYWDVQLKFDNQYDFGIIYLDVEPIKKQLSR